MSDYRTNYTFIPTNSAYNRINETSSYSITIIILIICCCCLIILGGVAYYSSLNNNSSTPKTTQPPIVTQSSQLQTTQSSQLPTAQSDKLYEFKEHKFTTAGKTGRFGPTLEEVKKAYSGVSWAQNIEFLNVKDGIQEWKVPETGKYIIRAVGSSGTDLNSNTDNNDKGVADMTGTFKLIKGDIIKILVGQKGVRGKPIKGEQCFGGSGGSFVVSDDILIIAGGGSTAPAKTETDSRKYSNFNKEGNTMHHKISYLTSFFSGGIDGRGGEKFESRPNRGQYEFGGGGGGYFTSGGNANFKKTPLPEGGKSFIEGGVGGKGNEGADGGFGGGGGSLNAEPHLYKTSEYCEPGGGGGYSGGFPGYGGGSINNGNDQNNKITQIEGDGFVIITKINRSDYSKELLDKNLKKIEEDERKKNEDTKKGLADAKIAQIQYQKKLEQDKIDYKRNAEAIAAIQKRWNDNQQ